MPEITNPDRRAAATIAAVERFNDAVNRGDAEATAAAMTDDCVFENTYPPPGGARYEGREAVRAFWEEFFRASRHAEFRTEEIFSAGDRCVVRWVYHWIDEHGTPGHVRGVDLFRVRDGKIAEKLSYVKG